jgi:drug/metabolite transporter (DMT)-like permease
MSTRAPADAPDATRAAQQPAAEAASGTARARSAHDPAAPIDWVLFGLLGLFWGSSYLFIKIGVETLPTFMLIAGRLGIGSLLLAAVLLASRERLPRSPRVYGHLVVLALINIVIPFTLITWGEQSIDSALAAILNSTVPLFTIVLAALVFVDEAITVNRVAGLVVGFAGVVILTSRSLGGSESSVLGELAMIGSSISYAAGSVYARKMVRGLRPMVPAFFQVFIAFLITASLALLTEAPSGVAIQPEAAFAVLWLGIFGSGLAYLLFYRLLRDWGSTRTSLVAYLLPVVGIVLGYAVLGETVDARILLGTALVIGGVALVNSRYGRRRLYGRSLSAGSAVAPGPTASVAPDPDAASPAPGRG